VYRRQSHFADLVRAISVLNGRATNQQIQNGGTIDVRLVKDRFVACPIA
jgi:hypothetical protein